MCTHLFWPFQQRAQKCSVRHHAVHSLCFRVLKIVLWLIHFASSVHIFLLPSAAKIRPRVPGAGFRVLAGGPGEWKSRGEGGEGGLGDSFPVNPSGAALWHPHAVARAAWAARAAPAPATVKVPAGGVRLEERLAP